MDIYYYKVESLLKMFIKQSIALTVGVNKPPKNETIQMKVECSTVYYAVYRSVDGSLVSV